MTAKSAKPIETLFTAIFETPFGMMFAAVNESGALTRLAFCRDSDTKPENLGGHIVVDRARCEAVARQMNAYYRGERQQFDLVLAPSGTPFQTRVWNALLQIPYGTTISYQALANRIDQPKAVRAVGHANGQNPIVVIVPCHRVIGSDGSLHGYGYGIDMKARLLNLEGAAPRLL